MVNLRYGKMQKWPLLQNKADIPYLGIYHNEKEQSRKPIQVFRAFNAFNHKVLVPMLTLSSPVLIMQSNYKGILVMMSLEFFGHFYVMMSMCEECQTALNINILKRLKSTQFHSLFLREFIAIFFPVVKSDPRLLKTQLGVVAVFLLSGHS